MLNQTPLPVVCFQDPAADSEDLGHHQALVDRANRRGRCWVSLALLAGVQPAIRACVSNYRTSSHDTDVLLEELEMARESRVEPLEST